MSRNFDKDIELAATQAKIAEAQGLFFSKCAISITLFAVCLGVLWSTLALVPWYGTLLAWSIILGPTGFLMRSAAREYKRAMERAANDFELIYQGKRIKWRTQEKAS